MRLTTTAKALAAAVANAKVPGSTSVEILRGVRIGAAEDAVRVTRTNMSLTVHEALPAEVVELGEVVVANADGFVKALRTLDGTVTLATEDEGLVVLAGPARLVFPTHELADWPKDATLEPVGTIGREVLFGALSRVLPFASKDEGRPVVTTVLFEVGKRKLVLAATDTYRLAVEEHACAGCKFTANVRADALGRLLALAGKTKAPTVAVCRSDLVASFEVDGHTVVTRLVDGKWPNWRSLFPDAHEFEVTVDRALLDAAAGRARALADVNRPVRLNFTKGALELVVTGRDMSAAYRERIPAGWKGKPFEIGIDAGFFADAVGSLEGDVATMRFVHPHRPIVLLSENPGSRHLLMPIKLAS